MSDTLVAILERILPRQVMEWPYLTHFIVFLILLLAALLLSSPYFPNSTVSEENNKDAYIALNVIGAIIATIGLYLTYKIWAGLYKSDNYNYIE